MYIIVTILVACLGLSYALVCLTIAANHLGKARSSPKPWRRRWVAVVYLDASLTGVLMAFLPIAKPLSYFVAVGINNGISLLLFATIPCGLAFFNRRGIFAVRNAFFIGVGLLSLGSTFYLLSIS